MDNQHESITESESDLFLAESANTNQDEKEEDPEMVIKRLMFRWLCKEVPPMIKVGDLDMHYDVLKENFPFE